MSLKPLPSSAPGRRARAAGFTLIEVLVSTAVGLTLLASLLTVQRFQLLAVEDQSTQLNVQSAARSFADLFVREVRRAGFDPSCSGAPETIVRATAAEVRVQADLDGSGAVDAPDEDVTYRFDLQRNRVERIAGDRAEVLLQGFDPERSAFRYFDGAGNELVPAPALTADQRAAVRRVRLDLVLTAARARGDRDVPVQASVAAEAELRNRYFVGTTNCA